MGLQADRWSFRQTLQSTSREDAWSNHFHRAQEERKVPRLPYLTSLYSDGEVRTAKSPPTSLETQVLKFTERDSRQTKGDSSTNLYKNSRYHTMLTWRWRMKVKKTTSTESEWHCAAGGHFIRSFCQQDTHCDSKFATRAEKQATRPTTNHLRQKQKETPHIHETPTTVSYCVLE
jgi:hypothetical protein